LPPLNQANIHTYAANKVANKSMGARIKNHGSLHAFRSAVSGKGSFASKAIGLATAFGKSAMNFIPIPVVGSFAATATGFIDGKIRSHLHGKAKDAAAVGSHDHVKFELKELSVEELDRLRWKVQNAITELNTAITSFNSQLVSADATGRSCDPLAAVAIAIAQGERRVKKMQDAITDIRDALDRAHTWAGTVGGSIATLKTGAFNTQWQAVVARDQALLTPPHNDPAELDRLHSHCGEFCYYKPNGGENFSASPGAAKLHLITVANLISQVATVDNVMGSVSLKTSDYSAGS